MTKPFLGKFAAFAAAAVLALSGCKQDPDNVTVNLPNNKQVAKVTYVIQVMEAGGANSANAAITGASLRYLNSEGKYAGTSIVSDANGNIVVPDVRPGNFSGTISSTEYGAISFIADVTKAGNDTAYTAITRVYMFPKSATLVGKVYGNYGMNATSIPSPTNASDVKEVELMLNYKLNMVGQDAYPMGSGPGRLVSVDLESKSELLNQGDGTASRFETLSPVYATESGMVQAFLSMIPKNFTAGSGSNQRDSTFTLSVGSPRNNLRVNLFRNNTTNVGNLLAKPVMMP